MTNESISSEPIPPFSRRSRRLFDRVKVASADARGLGVFATAPIKARHAVGRVVGTIKDSSNRSDYCIGYGDNQILEPEPPYRFLNHSCDPNCELIEWAIANPDEPLDSTESAPVLEIWAHALRDVEVGEELTIDYGWDWRSAIKCLCGSPKCRGWICRVDELDLCKRFHDSSEASE